MTRRVIREGAPWAGHAMTIVLSASRMEARCTCGWYPPPRTGLGTRGELRERALEDWMDLLDRVNRHALRDAKPT